MIPLPSDFLKSLTAIPGIDCDGLANSLDSPPEVSIRFNRRKILNDALRKGIIDGLAKDAVNVEWCRDGFYLPERPIFTLDPCLHAGAYYVQDASSMIYQQIIERLMPLLAERKEGGYPIVLDFCAAPGGKTTAIINALPDGSVVVANEYVAARGKALRENLEKWGYPWVITTGASAETYSRVPQIFDIVAVDAPCSGEGMMRKEEEARRQWSQRLVEECAELQRSILTDVAGTLRPGGYLIFSTCTFNIHENECNARFIEQELGLIPVAMSELGITGVGATAHAALPGVEALRFMPHLTRGEGLYVSVFRKPDSSESFGSRAKSGNNRKGSREKKISLPEELRHKVEEWLEPDLQPTLEVNGEMVTMLPAEAASVAETIRQAGVNVTGTGLPVAEIKRGGKKIDVVPDSRIVLNGAWRSAAFPEAALDRTTAQRYLRREAIVVDENIPLGFVVVTYEGLPLGLVKNIGNRANNLYPAPWRIRL